MNLKICKAKEEDISDILYFIMELAKFERLEHSAVATHESIKKYLFGEHPYAEVIFIEKDQTKVGFALYFFNFSTFLGKPGIYLEDLFILPNHRKNGYGKQLLSHIAKIAVDNHFGRFEWSVLDWNTEAIHFYHSLGAIPMSEWTLQRLTGESLVKLARLT